MIKEKTAGENLTENLRRLSDITDWFDKQEEIDVEEGLKKVKDAVALIKISRERLKAIENEFEEIKREADFDTGKGDSGSGFEGNN
ncbi:MAG: hypothetical protein A2981_00830 [Candidatus Nealsonbacteria bacterium RIFCSPLOWO2_01_FULL_38_120]|nr:MAG: hypothetical protein A2981_00830 [Candidatus Nealsonbacteria bacterium RIFCSPLOWO2_01_FULL_38_120]